MSEVALRKILIYVTIICVLLVTAAVLYYFVFIPNTSPNTIRETNNSLNWTGEEFYNSLEELEKDFGVYQACESEMNKKREEYLREKCHLPNTADVMKEIDCRSSTVSSKEFQEMFYCALP